MKGTVPNKIPSRSPLDTAGRLPHRQQEPIRLVWFLLNHGERASYQTSQSPETIIRPPVGLLQVPPPPQMQARGEAAFTPPARALPASPVIVMMPSMVPSSSRCGSGRGGAHTVRSGSDQRELSAKPPSPGAGSCSTKRGGCAPGSYRRPHPRPAARPGPALAAAAGTGAAGSLCQESSPPWSGAARGQWGAAHTQGGFASCRGQQDPESAAFLSKP